MYPRTKLSTIYRSIKIARNQKDKIHNVQNPNKITRKAIKQSYIIHDEEKNQLLETDQELTEVIEYVDQYSKIILMIFSIFKERAKNEHIK